MTPTDPDWQPDVWRSRPSYTTAVSPNRGYELLTFELPPLRLADTTENPDFARLVLAIGDEKRKLAPWTLLELPGDEGIHVAKRRGWLMRWYTSWLNVARREWLADWKRRRDAHFSPGAVHARVMASQ